MPGRVQGAAGLAPTCHRAWSVSSSRANDRLPVLMEVGGGPRWEGPAAAFCTRAPHWATRACIPPEQVTSPAVRTEYDGG